MTPEQLRQAIIEGSDEILTRPLIRGLMSEIQRKLLKAQRSYWTQASEEELRKLLALFTLMGED